MTLRFLNRVASAITRIPKSIKCSASNPRNILQFRDMSEKVDGNSGKERCTNDGQFFEGCFKKEPKKECPKEVKQKTGGCKKGCSKSTGCRREK